MFDFIIEVGGTEAASLTSTAKSEDPGTPWMCFFWMTVIDNGDVKTIQPHSIGWFANSVSHDHHDAFTIDTTQVQTIEGFIDWSNASADNSATLGQGEMVEMG